MMNRLGTSMKWGSAVCFVVSFGLLLAALPLDSLMDALRGWIAGLGLWAPLAYALTYGLAATLFIPASALSLAAGVLFGVWLGTAVVWFGATLAIALSFLIARYAARARVEDMSRTRPRFAAVDRAVGEQGWKIVALVRLSPVFPFTLQNYLFGITAIPFWRYLISSTTFIIPGVFLYVYVGYASGEAAAAVGSASGTDSLKLGLQLVGLLATVVVTVLVARIAAGAIAKHAPDNGATPTAQARKEEPAGSVVSAKAGLVFAISLVCLLASILAFSRRGALREHLLPPRAELTERYARPWGLATFDYGLVQVSRRDAGDPARTHGSLLAVPLRDGEPAAISESRAVRIR